MQGLLEAFGITFIENQRINSSKAFYGSLRCRARVSGAEYAAADANLRTGSGYGPIHGGWKLASPRNRNGGDNACFFWNDFDYSR
jgi:hypothetical protein